MAFSSSHITLLCVVGIILLARPVHAFGAGNIGSTSKIEGQNWRHGDLEDTLLTIIASRAMGGKKFSKLDVKRVYFGNWLRDYSQAVDVGTVKYVSAEAIRILLWVLGFMSFGYGSGEFEVTSQRLGCYRPEEHIDNPKDYAENEDARQYDRRLRGPVDERRELSINPQTGLKNYIASEGMGIETSAGLVRKLFGRSIELGRQYSRSKNKNDLYEALRLLGTGSHCLEDYAAHSNYVELALIELGERDIFPHVGRRTTIQLREARHPVYPIVTGTFGGVDFLHSVCGEFDDKTTQSEIEELDNTMQQYQNGGQNDSILQDLLNKIPSGVFGGKDQAGKASELKQNAVNHQMQNTHISPRQPEQWTQYLNDVQKQIYPIIEWHDDIMKSITETIEKIPILPDLLENLQEEINKFVFTLLAPYVVPIINQVKSELNTGSNEIIESSKAQQHIVFNDDNSSDPTHSMLSKDHFSNILNEPAGKVARQTVKWVVPQIVACWDDDRIDVERTLNRIIHGVLHHPVLRDAAQDGASDGRRAMFAVVEDWWRNQSEREKDGLREQLSRRGVESGRNHKPGVKDHGHGNNRPLGMTNLNFNSQPSIGGDIASGALGALGSAFGGGNQGYGGGGGRPSNVSRASDQLGKAASAAVGGGVLGSIVGGIAGQAGDILGGGLQQNEQTYKRESYNRQDGTRTETITQVGESQGGNRYGQAQYSTTYGQGGEQRHEEYNRFEQRETSSGGWQSEVRHEERTGAGRVHEETRRFDDDNNSSHGGRQQPAYGGRQEQSYGSRQEGYKSHKNKSDDDDSDDSEKKKYKKKHDKHRKDESDSDDDKRRPRRNDNQYASGGYGSENRQQQESSFGGGYGQQERRDEYSSGRGYERQEQSTTTSGGYGGRREEEISYNTGSRYGRGNDEQTNYGSGGYGGNERRQEQSYGSGGGYGQPEERSNYGSSGFGGGRQEEAYDVPGGFGSSRQDEYSSGGGGYGGGRGDEYGGGQQQTYGGGNQYGSRDDGNEEYGERRRQYGDDENENQSYGGGYGGSGY